MFLPLFFLCKPTPLIYEPASVFFQNPILHTIAELKVFRVLYGVMLRVDSVTGFPRANGAPIKRKVVGAFLFLYASLSNIQT